MGGIVDDIAEVFGLGDYVSFFEGQDIIQSSSFPETDRKMMALIRLLVNQSGYVGAREWLAKQLKLDEAQSKAFVKKCRKKIESLGISVIELSDKDAAILGKNRIPSLGKMMQERYGNAGNRKSRGRFAAIIYDEKSKRYKCNPTLHRADGSKYRTGIAGSKDESRESVEIKIIRRIGDNMVENFKSCRGDNEAVIRCYGYAREELMNYKGTVATADTIRNIDNWMERIDDEVAKLKGDVGNV